MKTGLISFILGLVILLMLGERQQALAYLDPGTGSLLLQVLIGGVAGGLVVLKRYWKRIKEIFGGSASTQAKAHPNSSADDKTE